MFECPGVDAPSRPMAAAVTEIDKATDPSLLPAID